MRLKAASVVPYLRERGLVDRAGLVDDEWTVVPETRRHYSFHVHRRGGRGFFVKQAADGAHGARWTLRREAGVGWLARNDERFAALRGIVPTALSYDSRRAVFVSALVDAVPLRFGGATPAAALGAALARVHAVEAVRFPGRLPWILQLPDWGPRDLAALDPGRRAFAARVQGDPALASVLSALAREHRATALVHNDLKADNVLGCGDGTVRLADWELADRGDPAWDVGAALLMLRPADRRACLASYGETSSSFLDRCRRCAAGRAVQSAYESRGAEEPWLRRARAWLASRPELVA